MAEVQQMNRMSLDTICNFVVFEMNPRLHPELLDEWEFTILPDVCKDVRKLKGCITYNWFASVDQPRQYICQEIFMNSDTYESYLISEPYRYLMEYVSRGRALVGKMGREIEE